MCFTLKLYRSYSVCNMCTFVIKCIKQRNVLQNNIITTTAVSKGFVLYFLLAIEGIGRYVNVVRLRVSIIPNKCPLDIYTHLPN